MCRLEDVISDTIVITNRALVRGSYYGQLEKVAQLHPYAMILREKELSKEEYERMALRVLAICEREGVLCFLHCKPSLAKKIGGKNIHLPIHRFLEEKKELEGFERVSVSCHSLTEVKRAIEEGADQIILGTIFETDCKPGLHGKGLDFVRSICAYSKVHGNVPVYAIGGISPDNLKPVMEAGAKGGCMMSYLMKY